MYNKKNTEYHIAFNALFDSEVIGKFYFFTVVNIENVYIVVHIIYTNWRLFDLVLKFVFGCPLPLIYQWIYSRWNTIGRVSYFVFICNYKEKPCGCRRNVKYVINVLRCGTLMVLEKVITTIYFQRSSCA